MHASDTFRSTTTAGLLENLVIGHGIHIRLLLAICFTLSGIMYVPIGHDAVHALIPAASASFPGLHVEHVRLLVAPVAGEYVPTGQLKQAEAPSSSA